MFATKNDLSEGVRVKVIQLLNERLADGIDLQTQTKQAHWNVKGKDFYQLHLLFDEMAEELSGFVDLIAERATALGGYACGTARMAAENSELPEYPTDAIEGMDHVKALADRYARYAARLRRSIDDADGLGDKSTADLYTEVSRAVDKRLWFLEAHLQA